MKKLLLLSAFIIFPFMAHATTETNFKLISTQEKNLRANYTRQQEALNASDITNKSILSIMEKLEGKSQILPPRRFTPETIEQVNTLIIQDKIHLYARAKSYTPVLYTKDFSKVFGGSSGGLMLDDYYQIDPLEFVAFPLTSFDIKSLSFDGKNLILRVVSDEYSYVADSGHYIDARFVDILWKPVSKPANRNIINPKPETVIQKLRRQVGKIYIWGGNAQGGVNKLLTYYRPKTQIDAITKKKWTLNGFDCSGLLFWATNGYTPRNTSNLVNFGSGLEIAGKTKEEVKAMLKPLDVIVWVGHNMIVIDNNEVIESRVDFGTGPDKENGVRIRTIDDVLDEVYSKKIAVNNWKDTVAEGKKKFVIRRWIEQ